MKGWAVFCWGCKTGCPMSKLETPDYINVLELKATKFAIMTFSKIFPNVKIVHWTLWKTNGQHGDPNS